MPVALTIAGSDPSGGAGLQADLKTFHQHGVYGMAVPTLVTVQSTRGVVAVETLPPALVAAQLEYLFADITPGAVKTGALGTLSLVEVVARTLIDRPLVVDPVMVSKQGHSLIDADARLALVERLLPRAFLVTPNVEEASVLAEMEVRTLAHARIAAKRIAARGAKNVLVKGGHLQGPPVDVLLYEGELIEIPGTRIATIHTHGTGCTLSAAITAELALGSSLPRAVRRAKAWVARALRTPPDVGNGVGPVNHFTTVARR